MYSYNIFEDITNGNKRSNENLIRLSNKKLRTDEQILCIYDNLIKNNENNTFITSNLKLYQFENCTNLTV
uniref:CSON014647 protein n=1 Tax=Culicoides sonorensis TaxID=179676 RepID=A0A336MNI8_CULSO